MRYNQSKHGITFGALVCHFPAIMMGTTYSICKRFLEKLYSLIVKSNESKSIEYTDRKRIISNTKNENIRKVHDHLNIDYM